MAWLEAIWAVTVALIFLLLPGYPAAKLIGAKGLWLHALTPAVSVSLLSFLSLVFSLTHIPWQPWITLTVAILLSFITGLIMRKSKIRLLTAPAAHKIYFSTILGILILGAVTVTLTVTGITNLENISQTFDNIFHLNLITYIGDTSIASPLEVGRLTSGGKDPAFYPAIWHALVSLVQHFSGASVALSLNAVNIALILSVFAPGTMLLTRQLGGSRIAEIFTGIIAASVPGFPIEMLIYGVLYPFFMALTFLPLLITLVLQLCGFCANERIAPVGQLSFITFAVSCGVIMAHPGSVMAAIVCSIPAVLAAFCRGFKALTPILRMRRVVLLVAYLNIVFIISYRLNVGSSWSSRASIREVLYNLLTLSPMGYSKQPVVTALLVFITIYAAIILWRKHLGYRVLKFTAPQSLQHKTLLVLSAMTGIMMILFFIAKAINNRYLRYFTQLWYGDSERLGAILCILAVPLAAVGAATLIRALPQLLTPKLRPLVGAIVGVSIIAAVLTGAEFKKTTGILHDVYALTDNSVLLTKDEMTLLKRLPNNVPENAVIAGSPWTGTSLAYAIAHRRVLLPHVFTNDSDSKIQRVRLWLNVSHVYPPACKAAADLNVKYFLDFGSQTIFDYAQISRGLRSGKTGAFELVDREGDAALYKVAECQK